MSNREEAQAVLDAIQHQINQLRNVDVWLTHDLNVLYRAQRELAQVVKKNENLI